MSTAKKDPKKASVKKPAVKKASVQKDAVQKTSLQSTVSRIRKMRSAHQEVFADRRPVSVIKPVVAAPKAEAPVKTEAAAPRVAKAPKAEGRSHKGVLNKAAFWLGALFSDGQALLSSGKTK